MEEIEISSWLILDTLKKTGEVKETIGNLQTGHNMSIFCVIDDDYLELCYSDMASNYLKRYENKEEFQMAIEKRMEDAGEAPYDENLEYEETYGDEETEDDFGFDKD